KTSGLTLALSGTAGSALNSVVQATQDARSAGSSRLQALQGVKAALSGVQASQAARLDAAQGNDPANNNTVGVSLSYGSQSSKSTQRSEQTTAQGSSLTAGRDLSITAREGDLNAVGSQLKAGNDMALSARRDINLVSAENTSLLEGKNDSHGGTIGVGIGVGSGGWGISVSASANKGKGSESGNGTTHSETTVDAGNNLILNSGRDTTLTGAQVSGDKVVMDVGRNLTLTSEQDSDRYDSRQQNASAGGSFTFGSMSGSASVNLSKDKMHSNYDSVVEQTGIFAGKGGYDITVGEHTQLNGAVIGSTATADKNRLDTGTLGWGDIDNRADFKTEHQSVGFSSGGSIGSQFAGNMANGLLTGGNNEGHDSSTTRAAVSDGDIIVRDKDRQQQDVANLSRDVEHANQTLSPIFDKEKEQQRLQQTQLIGEIGNQVADIARTEGQISAINAGKAELAARGVNEPEKGASKEAWERYNAQLAATDGYKAAQQQWGTGSAIQQGIQAATAVVQGLAGSDLKAALAGGAAPYVAEVIGHYSNLDDAGKVAAHAVVNAVLAAAQNQSALAGAAGAATAEIVGIIATQMYGKPVSELDETQKQTVSTLATLAAGLAGGLAGDSSASAISGAQAGKTTVENNLFGGNEESQAEWIRQHGIDMATCSTAPSSASCQKAINERDAVGLALATGSAALLPGGAQAMWGLGAGANAGISYLADGTIDPANAAIAGWVNVISMGNGLAGTVGWNAAGGAFGNWLDGKDPLSGAAMSGGTSAIGYGVGKVIQGPLEKVINPNWKNWEWTDVGMGISKPLPLNPTPGIAGNIGSSIGSEGSGAIIQDQIKNQQEKKK
ncbi:TPA: hemagglutinin repeat-containing protein, partial [Raoultella planticola]